MSLHHCSCCSLLSQPQQRKPAAAQQTPAGEREREREREREWFPTLQNFLERSAKEMQQAPFNFHWGRGKKRKEKAKETSAPLG